MRKIIETSKRLVHKALKTRQSKDNYDVELLITKNPDKTRITANTINA